MLVISRHLFKQITPSSAFPVDFSHQVESSIGPTRGITTRRKTRIAHANQQGLSRCAESEAEVRFFSSRRFCNSVIDRSFLTRSETRRQCI